MIADTIRHLKGHKKFVIYDAEHSFDGFNDEPEYALDTWHAAEKAGADFIVLCDTNGGRLPGEIARITDIARSKLNTKSAFILTMTSALASPMLWPESRPAQPRFKVLSMAMVNALAIAISLASSRI